MKFEQLGIIAFFGVLVPGAYLTAFLMLGFACLLELGGIQGYAEIFAFMSQHSLLSSTAFLFISYLLGVVIRLFSVRIVDKASMLFLRFICRKKEEWLDDIFPYQQILGKRLDKEGMSPVTELIKSLNEKYGQDNNTSFFYYCKFFVEANNETLAKQIREDEALIRFLAGTVFALIISCFVGLSFSITFRVTHQSPFLQLLYASLTLVSLIILAGILGRFNGQRQREVRDVWMCLYLLLKGGIPNTLGISSNELQKRITLEMTQNTSFPGNSDNNQTHKSETLENP